VWPYVVTMKTKVAISLIFVVLSTVVYAHEPSAGRVAATLGPMLYKTYYRPSSGMNDPWKVGLALIAEADVDYNGGIEIAMVYFDKSYLRRENGQFIIEKIKRTKVTTGYRHWFSPWISAGFSIFSSYSMGDARVIHDGTAEDRDPKTSARKITENGADVSIQADLWTSGDYALSIDLRSEIPASAKPLEDAVLYGAILGLKYLIPPERLGGQRS